MSNWTGVEVWMNMWWVVIEHVMCNGHCTFKKTKSKRGKYFLYWNWISIIIATYKFKTILSCIIGLMYT